MPTLIIIDMQPDFIYRHEQFPGYGKTIDAVKEEIVAAKKRNDYIVFVEYCSESRSTRGMFNRFPSKHAPTLPELLDLTANYPNKVFAYKKTNDGGEEVVAALNYYAISKLHLRVCGVYTNACVRSTVSTISDELPNSSIKVIKGATCAPQGDAWHQGYGLSMMKDLSNVWIF